MGKTAYVVCFLVLSGCGGTQAPPKVESAEPVAAKIERPRSGMHVATELGEIDRAETVKTFDRLQSSFLDCQKRGVDRVEYLEGDVKFFVRVGQDGKVRWTYLEESSLGDFETEKCMLDAIRGAAWPKPQGGEAEVRSSTALQPQNGRPPAQWNADKVAAVVAKEGPAASKCKAGTSGKFHVTAYVRPSGKAGKMGKVQAAGVSIPSKEGAAAAECIVQEVMGWTMPSPGSWAAKVSFDL